MGTACRLISMPALITGVFTDVQHGFQAVISLARSTWQWFLKAIIMRTVFNDFDRGSLKA